MMKPPTQSLSLHLSLSFSLRPHTGSHHLHTHVHAHTSPHPIPTLVPGVASAPLHSLAKSRSGAQERSFSTSNRNGAAADGQNGEQGANDSTSGCRCGQNKATEPDDDSTERELYSSPSFTMAPSASSSPSIALGGRRFQSTITGARSPESDGQLPGHHESSLFPNMKMGGGGSKARARKEAIESQRDLILSILEANPTSRDSRSYLKNFAPNGSPQKPRQANAKPTTSATPFPFLPKNPPSSQAGPSSLGHKLQHLLPPNATGGTHGPQLMKIDPTSSTTTTVTGEFPTDSVVMPTTAFPPPPPHSPLLQQQQTHQQDHERNLVVESILSHASQHTAMVKIQGPFTDRQLDSIVEGIVYLRRLGLLSVIVVDHEDWMKASGAEKNWKVKEEMMNEMMRIVEVFEEKDVGARPLAENVLRLKSGAGIDGTGGAELEVDVESLNGIHAAIRNDEIPVIPPIALGPSLRSTCIPADSAIRALTRALAKDGVRLAEEALSKADATEGGIEALGGLGSLVRTDLTPLRIMVINREGGIPSPARGGNPHLSINLASEYDHIESTFTWNESHPTSLSNLSLIQSCLADLPRTSSGIIVSHKSPKALIGNLITNKPAHSPSLHHSLLPHDKVSATPTIVRHGLPIRVIRNMDQIDKEKMTELLEQSFGKVLEAAPFYGRLERDLDFAIVAGDYQGIAIVTKERDSLDPTSPPICYLDKFAVLPSLQGDGTVDFLWGALRDESFGLGLLDALNNNGGMEGRGIGKDLVWRSRADNPVNKWYFERSNGFVRIPEPNQDGNDGSAKSKSKWTMFWCDAEARLERFKREAAASASKASAVGTTELSVQGKACSKPGCEKQKARDRPTLTILAEEEKGRLDRWSRVIGAIPSCWKVGVTKNM